ncbi:hypothetical protein A3Q56_05463, partial [Intoshia linei]
MIFQHKYFKFVVYGSPIVVLLSLTGHVSWKVMSSLDEKLQMKHFDITMDQNKFIPL